MVPYYYKKNAIDEFYRESKTKYKSIMTYRTTEAQLASPNLHAYLRQLPVVSLPNKRNSEETIVAAGAVKIGYYWKEKGFYIAKSDFDNQTSSHESPIEAENCLFEACINTLE